MHKKLKYKKVFQYKKDANKHRISNLFFDKVRNWLIIHNNYLRRIDIIDLNTGETQISLDYKEKWDETFIYRALDIDEKKHQLLMAFNDKWVVWDYLNNAIIHEQSIPSTQIPGINFSLDKQHIWVNDESYLWVYENITYELVGKIKTRGLYSLPLTWHSQDTFLFIEMERGGSDVVVGKVVNKDGKIDVVWDYENKMFSRSYLLSSVQVSPCGNYVILTDEGLQLYRYPNLERLYIWNSYALIDNDWQANPYPKTYWTPVVFLEYGEKIIIGTFSEDVLLFKELLTAKEIFHTSFLQTPFETDNIYDQMVLGIKTSFYTFIQKNNQILYAANDLGEVYEIDLEDKIEEALKNMD